MKRLVIPLLATLLLSCSQGPLEAPIQTEVSIDSLLQVNDSLRLQLGRVSCLSRCFLSTLDSLGITPHCECGR